MAGLRGLATFRGDQLNGKIMRDRHFDEDNKINEKYIDIDFNEHRESLVDTKIDVFSQVNDKIVAGKSFIDITNDLGGKEVATDTKEGVVLDVRVDLRENGTEDFPFIDADGDRVYGRVTSEEMDVFDSEDNPIGTEMHYILRFYSEVNGVEEPYTFSEETDNLDFRYQLRTNLAVIPVDALINGGAGFVEGATDANAYMNLNQLMLDLYGATGTLNNDGNSTLTVNIVKQIADEIDARKKADKDMLDGFASKEEGNGAALIGVVLNEDADYTGTTVQEVLTELAKKVKDNQDGLDDRTEKLETEHEEEVYEAVGGETEYMLVNGKAKNKTVLLFLNGQLQAPTINFEYIKDVEGSIIGFNFSPDTLKVHDNIPDVLFVQYKKIQ